MSLCSAILQCQIPLIIGIPIPIIESIQKLILLEIYMNVILGVLDVVNSKE